MFLSVVVLSLELLLEPDGPRVQEVKRIRVTLKTVHHYALMLGAAKEPYSCMKLNHFQCIDAVLLK